VGVYVCLINQYSEYVTKTEWTKGGEKNPFLTTTPETTQYYQYVSGNNVVGKSQSA